MVRGLDRFQEHFRDYEDRYVLIGGTAVFVAMDESGLDFRATKDLDIVIIIESLDESLDAEFGRAFWAFVEAGGYENRQQSTGEARFYRFFSPEDETFPYQLELFSRSPLGISIPQDAHLTPLPIEEEVSSLSAILLNDDYYEFVRDGARKLQGLSVLAPEYLIPMKARAWLDLKQRKAQGEDISSGEIKKHRNDVIRLSQLLPGDARFDLPLSISEDMRAFMESAFRDAPPPKQVGVSGMTIADVEEALREAYGVGA